MIAPRIIQGDARALDLPDESVDLIVTSPPYFGLRDYGVPGQLGAEATPREFIAAVVECTREMVRVLKPSGSIFVNLGDKYANSPPSKTSEYVTGLTGGRSFRASRDRTRRDFGVPTKSLCLLPERYRIAAVDELGLIARAVIVWSKPNGLPESVTDRVRRSHEDWVHLTKAPRYFSAIDEVREPYAANPLGKLPCSVWEISTQPLRVPAEIGVDHFAAFPMEWPRRLILGWCPAEVCTACGEGRRPVVERGSIDPVRRAEIAARRAGSAIALGSEARSRRIGATSATKLLSGQEYNALRSPDAITGYACDCSDTSAPSTPGVVLDPFGGTGTTALVAAMHGRVGISVDLSANYCRLAEWRVNDPKQRERASRPANRRAA